MRKKVTIAGAGLVGSLEAIYLAKRGFQVEVYERRPDMRKIELSAGRSINLALSARGWNALKAVGVDQEVEKMAIPMYKRVMHAVDGSLTDQQYGQDGEAIYSVSRGGLNQLLINLAGEQENVNMHFNYKCVDVDLMSASATFEHNDGNQKNVYADMIIGADGAYSVIRSKMIKQDRFQYSQHYIEHGYKELTIPANSDGTYKLEVNALHIWPRGSYMLIALPNMDGSFTCTLFFPYEGEYSFNSLQSEQQVYDFFKEVFPDTLDLIPNLVEEYFQNPTSSLAIMRCNPWTVDDKVLLIGDAAHATVPFYGQGMNAGFEGCFVLDQLMQKHGEDWQACFDEYSEIRKPDGDGVQDLSMHNFIVMRDKTADPKFLLQKKIELHFSKKYPNMWLPLYSMVSFSTIRYSEAWEIGQKQEKLMQKVMDIPNIEDKWDSDEVEQLILSLIA
ncbi:FAD-dependent monooxygenase [Flavobacteriales bacterium]|nr:FAD-dependent monooxygenase [Flavobacteriales bacterium]